MSGYVYFIKSPAMNAVKVGYSSSNPKRRLRSMQTGNADDLVLLGWCCGTPEKEAHFHHEYRDYHIRGEWFRLEGDFAKFIESFQRVYWSAQRELHEAEVA